MSRRKPVNLVAEGQVITGIVVNIAPFGLFVEVVPGYLDAVLRFEQTPYSEIAKKLQVGQKIEVIVRVVDSQKEIVRVELLPDPTRYEGFWAKG